MAVFTDPLFRSRTLINTFATFRHTTSSSPRPPASTVSSPFSTLHSPSLTPPSPSGGQPHPHTNSANTGILIAVCAIALCLVSASLLHVVRNRRRTLAVGANLFTRARRRTSLNSHSFGDALSPVGTNRVGDGSVLESNEANTRANRSLDARTSSTDLSAVDRAAHLSHPHLESIDELLASEKLFRELRNQPVPTSTSWDSVNDPTEAVAEARTLAFYGSSGIVQSRTPRHATDGGIRLAGGRPGEGVANDSENDVDQHRGSDASILPPPYSSHCG